MGEHMTSERIASFESATDPKTQPIPALGQWVGWNDESHMDIRKPVHGHIKNDEFLVYLLAHSENGSILRR